MDDEIIFLVAEKECRVDAYLAEYTELSRTRIQALIRDGRALVDSAPVKVNHVLAIGQSIQLTVPAAAPVSVQPENIPISIVYEDADICVVDKPQGMVVHPAPGNESGTLVNALLFHLKDLSGIGGELRPGIVHRIDKMTSGLIVVAKNDAAHESLARQFHDHSAGRSYLAIADGVIKPDEGTVEGNIGRHRTDRKRMAIVPNGRPAVTHYRVLTRFAQNTLLYLRLETGRTHQIRVHMASIRHPITGDTVYGKPAPKLGLDGQALHGYRLVLMHPASGEQMEFIAPLPAYFRRALQKLGWNEVLTV